MEKTERERKRPLVVYLDDRLSAWLEAKAQEGYKKASLVRRILEEHIRFKGVAQ